MLICVDRLSADIKMFRGMLVVENVESKIEHDLVQNAR